jgi:hypothetical protein
MELFSAAFYPAVLAVLDDPYLAALGFVPVARFDGTIPRCRAFGALACTACFSQHQCFAWTQMAPAGVATLQCSNWARQPAYTAADILPRHDSMYVTVTIAHLQVFQLWRKEGETTSVGFVLSAVHVEALRSRLDELITVEKGDRDRLVADVSTHTTRSEPVAKQLRAG